MISHHYFDNHGIFEASSSAPALAKLSAGRTTCCLSLFSYIQISEGLPAAVLEPKSARDLRVMGPIDANFCRT